MRGLRLVAFIAFCIFAVLELGEWLGMSPGYFNPASFTEFTGLDPDAQSARLMILATLTMGIAAAAALTAFALWRGLGWASWTGQITGVLFFVYAAYQITSALFLLNRNQSAVLSAAIIYALIGVTAIALGRRALQAR
jgi:uncharacterized membrane protein (DUF2068 family)